MKKIHSIFLLFLFFNTILYAQSNHDFKTYLAYYNSTKIAEANNLVYAVTDGSLMAYNKTDNNVTFFSKQTGMSDNSITHIAYNSKVNTLIVIYKNGNIDLLNEDGKVYNISHFMMNNNFPFKELNNIDIHNDMAYLSMQFGVIAVDMNKKEIRDTYRIINNAVYSVSNLNNEIYASTAKGLYKASVSSNLVDISNWKLAEIPFQNANDTIIKTVVFNDKLCFIIKNNGIKGVSYLDNDRTVKTLLNHNALTNLKVENGKMIAHSKTNAYIYSSLSSFDNINLGTVNDISSLKDVNTFWVASGMNIMKGVKKNASSGQYETFLTELKTDSPRDNNFFYMQTEDNKLLTVGGGFANQRSDRKGKLSTYEDGTWFNFDESKIQYGTSHYYSGPKDFTSVAVSPVDPSLYYVSSYGEGLIEIKDNEFSKIYTIGNSELESATTSNQYQYTRLSGLAFDKDNNLWMTNVETNYPVKVLKPDGSWAKFAFKNLLSKPQLMDKILITSRNHKWLNFFYKDKYNNQPGLLIFKDNELTEDESQSVFYSSLKNSSGNDLGVNAVWCTAEDNKGNIWIGTNKGPIYTPVPQNALENPDRFYFTQIIREGEENYIFLNGEQVNAIAVDGGNRKWIGTESSGVYLVSEDGMETIHNFTTSNSPILSNKITSLAINKQTGEVFIGTNNGLISFMSEGSEGKESYSDVYAFPNPVRPEYEDKVTITGLMTDSNVKITDVSGNLIYQSKSVGGQLVWNCRNHRGSRVATGIYLVIAASPEGKESVVTKIMIVK